MEGSFCAKCGAAAGGSGARSTGMEDHVASALCYVGGFVTGLLFLLLEPYSRNRTIRFHAFQSILFNAAFIVLYFAIGMAMPFGMQFMISPILILGAMAVWALLIYKAYKKERFLLPVIGPIAEKQV
ncbi:MAG: DUF4870 domain-containing protein [Bryobacteraceae bacterium]